MDIDDLTYEHQIISQAKFLLNQENGGKIGDTVLLPKSIVLLKTFAFLSHENKKLKGSVRFSTLEKIIDDFTNSRSIKESLNELNQLLNNKLGENTPDNVALKDILDKIEILILLSFIDKSKTIKFIDENLMNNLIKVLETFETNKDYLSLLKNYRDGYDNDAFMVTPEKNIVVEALMQLKLNEVINSDSTKRDFYRKIKTRRLLFIKEVHDKLDLFKNNSIFKPSSQIIYEMVMASSVLILLSYDNIIALNKPESQIYLENEIDSEMIESEISMRTEEARKKIITFSLPLSSILGEKYKVPMFLVIAVYIFIWVIFSILLYFHYFYINYEFIITIVLFSLYLLHESYVKSYRKIN